MNKYLFVFALLILKLFSCNEHKVVKDDNSVQEISLNVFIPKDESLIELINIHSDSLNNYSVKEVIPAFVGNADFDLSNHGYWPSTHLPVSLRQMILENTVNLEVLDKIIRDEKCQVTPNKWGETTDFVPFGKFSWAQLAKFRKQKLIQLKNLN